MAISDSFDIVSVDDEDEESETRPTRNIIVSSLLSATVPSLLQVPDMVVTSESESETTTPTHEATSAASSEAADVPLTSSPRTEVVVTSKPPRTTDGDDEQPELRAVVVMDQGYHLYRPPSAAALTWIHSETSLATSISSSGLEGTPATTNVQSASSVFVGETFSVQSEQQHQAADAYAIGAEESDEFVAVAASENNEEEKEEITDTFESFNQSTAGAAHSIDAHQHQHQQDPLAGMPTYAVGTYATLPELATVLGGSSHASSDDESDLAALKRAAAYGGGANQKPNPRATEDLDRFFHRTCEFWNALAVDAQAAGDTIDIGRVMEDSIRLAREHYMMVTAVARPEVPPQVATVVEITEEYVHPSDLQSHNAVRAEFLGQEYIGSRRQDNTTHSTDTALSGGSHPDVTPATAAAHAVSELDVPTAAAAEVYGSPYFGDTIATMDHPHTTVAQHVSSPTATAIEATEVHDSFFEQAAEATVIDSAPASKAESQIAWQNTEEAQVLEDSSSAVVDESMMDRKPPAVDTPSRQLSNSRGDSSFAVAEQVGDVLSIEEHLHPAEFVDAHDAEAELVGTDFLYATGVESAEASSGDAVFSSSAELRGSPSPETREPMGMTPGPSVPVTPSAEVIYSTLSPPAGNDEVHAVLVEDTNGGSADSNDDVPVAASVVTPFQDRTPSNSSDQSATKFVSPDVGDRVGANSTGGHVRTESSETSTFHWPSTGDGATSDYPGRESASARIHTFHHGTPADSSPTPEWLLESPPRETADRQTSGQSNGSQRSQLQLVSERASQMTAQLARSTGSVMESLFGDKPPLVGGRRGRVNTSEIAQSVFGRTLLPWSVIHNTSNQTWVATLQTNQKALDGKNVKEASKSLRAFSLPSEQQAICLAKSWTPPRMQPFQDSPACHICKTKFAMFRRPCHCRNCGVCVCKDCAVQWPAKMVPETYNIKKESTINACKSCEWLCNTFRLALLEGKMDEAVAVHATGNINLTMPFANVKGEEFFPVHCAVLGGNPQLLRWLVDEHCCPIKSVRVSGKAARDLSNRYTPIVTSRGRSLLGIAMENECVEIVRYLVVNKGLSIAGEKDISTVMLIKNLDKVLRVMPDTASPSGASFGYPPESPDYVEGDYAPPPPSAPTFSGDPEPHVPSEDFSCAGFGASRSDWLTDEGDGENDDDECIICFDGKIDCVATPCGHQMCCLNCSANISRCPVCAQDCSFLRVFKP